MKAFSTKSSWLSGAKSAVNAGLERCPFRNTRSGFPLTIRGAKSARKQSNATNRSAAPAPPSPAKRGLRRSRSSCTRRRPTALRPRRRQRRSSIPKRASRARKRRLRARPISLPRPSPTTQTCAKICASCTCAGRTSSPWRRKKIPKIPFTAIITPSLPPSIRSKGIRCSPSTAGSGRRCSKSASSSTATWRSARCAAASSKRSAPPRNSWKPPQPTRTTASSRPRWSARSAPPSPKRRARGRSDSSRST